MQFSPEEIFLKDQGWLPGIYERVQRELRGGLLGLSFTQCGFCWYCSTEIPQHCFLACDKWCPRWRSSEGSPWDDKLLLFCSCYEPAPATPNTSAVPGIALLGQWWCTCALGRFWVHSYEQEGYFLLPGSMVKMVLFMGTFVRPTLVRVIAGGWYSIKCQLLLEICTMFHWKNVLVWSLPDLQLVMGACLIGLWC